MSRFKKGDEVVVLDMPSLLSTQVKNVGQCFTVNKLAVNVTNAQLVLLDNCSSAYYENELEFEHIYNSPLYRALQ